MEGVEGVEGFGAIWKVAGRALRALADLADAFGMAQGFWKRRGRGGQIWYTRIGGTVRSTGCHDREAAERWRAAEERRAADPAHPAQAYPIGALMADALAAQQRAGRAPATLTILRQKAAHLIRLLGADRDARTLTTEDLERYIAQREKEPADPGRRRTVTRHTIAKELGALRMALRRAQRRGRWHGDTRALFPEYGPSYSGRTRTLSVEESCALLIALAPERRLMVGFFLATGARLSEARRITWADFTPPIVHLPGRKTARSDRYLAISAELAALLESARGAPSAPMFGPWLQMNRDIKRACRRADIAPCSPNDFRRTFATWHRENGTDPPTVAALMGNSPAMVNGIYARPSRAMLIAAMQRGEATTVAAIAPLLRQEAAAMTRTATETVSPVGVEPTPNGLKGRSPGGEITRPPAHLHPYAETMAASTVAGRSPAPVLAALQYAAERDVRQHRAELCLMLEAAADAARTSDDLDAIRAGISDARAAADRLERALESREDFAAAARSAAGALR